MSDSILSDHLAAPVALYLNNQSKSLLIKDLKQDWTITQLYQVVESMLGVEEDGFDIISDDELLERCSQTVKARGLIDGTTLTFVLYTRGGGGSSSTPAPTPTPTPRPTPVRIPTTNSSNNTTTSNSTSNMPTSKPNNRLKPLPGFIELTDEPCCAWNDDNPDEKRAKMPCGCAIAAEAMKNCVNLTLKEGKYKIECPGCNAQLKLKHVFHVLSAVMTVDELRETSLKVSLLSMQKPEFDIRQCGMCQTYCMRNTESNRIKCGVCTKANGGNEVDFCWVCSKRWKINGRGSCESCEKIELDCLKTLANCQTKQIGGVEGVPIYRACPKCGFLISHKANCKHMTCKCCGCNFCFICLKTQLGGSWQCGSYNSLCSVASRQTELPKPELT